MREKNENIVEKYEQLSMIDQSHILGYMAYMLSMDPKFNLFTFERMYKFFPDKYKAWVTNWIEELRPTAQKEIIDFARVKERYGTVRGVCSHPGEL